MLVQAANYAMNNMPPIGQINGAQVAATGMMSERQRRNIAEARAAEGKGFGVSTDTVLEALEGGVPIPGLNMIGNVAGAGIGFVVADRKAEKATKELIDQYRDQIAAQLNIPENKVDLKALLFAARKNRNLERALSAIEDEKSAHPFINISGIVGMAIGMVVGLPIPFIGSIVAGMAGFFAGSWVGNHLLAPEPMLNPQEHMRMIYAKRDRGEPVTTKDIFALRVAQKGNLHENIKDQYGKDFFYLNAQDQNHVFNHYAAITQQCVRDAALCNQGENVGQLLFGPMKELPPVVQEFQDLRALVKAPEPQQQQQMDGFWSARVNRQAPQGSFVERLNQQRAAAAMNQQSELS